MTYQLVCSVTLLFVSLSLGSTPVDKESILQKPLTSKKLVMAHYMTNIIRYRGHKLEDSCDPAYYSPFNNITSSIGGLTQVLVLSDNFLKQKTLEEAVEFEMRTAIKSGVDGFQFYFTLGGGNGDEIIKAFLRVANAKNIDFKFALCISHPSGGKSVDRIRNFSIRINSLLNETGRDDPHWLRTPDGRLVMYTWYGDGLADHPSDLNGRSKASYVAAAYDSLALAVNEKFACIISINEQITDQDLNDYLDYFPAVWLWTLPYTDQFIGARIAHVCKKRERTFTGSVFPDFYTSKLIRRNTWDMFHKAEEAVAAGKKGAERKYIACGLSYNFRKQLEFCIDQDVPLINLITWNDYPEGHHLAPEANHNDGFSLLLRYYGNKWRQGGSTNIIGPTVIAFYKKYSHRCRPSPFSYPVTQIEKPGVPETVEDSLEVITILDHPATVQYRHQLKEVKSGIQSVMLAAEPGLVSVSVSGKSDDQQVLHLVCPEWITSHPYRTDRLTYSFSNHSHQFYRDVFGGDFQLPVPEYDQSQPTAAINQFSKAGKHE